MSLTSPGFFESIIPMAFMVIVSGYYTQSEQAFRQSWWFSGTGWFTIIGNALNYGFAQITGGSLRPWQYIYILAGCLTLVFGLWCFALPESALDAWFLSAQERIAATERLRAGQTGVRNREVKLSQVKEGALDPVTWLVALIMSSACVQPPLPPCTDRLLTQASTGTPSMEPSPASGR